jgi:hypothetical protein
VPSILRATLIVGHASRTLPEFFTASMRPAISSRSGSLVPGRLAALAKPVFGFSTEGESPTSRFIAQYLSEIETFKAPGM